MQNIDINRTKANSWVFLFDLITPFLSEKHIRAQSLFRGIGILLLDVLVLFGSLKER